MGDEEILVEKDGNLKVVQHYNLRFLLRRLRGDDLQRRLVVRGWNCRQKCQDHTFVLKCLFVFILLYSLSRMIFEPFITNPFDATTLGRVLRMISLSYQLLWVGIMFVTMLIAVRLLMKMKTTAPPLRKEELKTISGLIQHL